MAQFNPGDGSGTAIVSGIVSYIQAGGSVQTLLTSSVVGVFLSPVLVTISIINSAGNFFTTPFDSAAAAIGSLANAFFTAPGNLLTAGSEVSESALRAVFGDTIAGIFGLPIAFGVVFISLLLLARYLNEEETSNTIPGIGLDVPFLGRNEEDTAAE